MTPDYKDNSGRYSVKTIEYEDERTMAITIMLVKFDGRGNPALESAGWRGEYLSAIKVDGDFGYSTNDLRMFADRMEANKDGELKRFLVCLDTERIPWDAVHDGETYTRSKLEEILEKYE